MTKNMSIYQGAFKRLDRQKRELIERYLTSGRSCSDIAREINCSLSTVTREIKAHKTVSQARTKTMTGKISNLCALGYACEKTNVCTVCIRRNHPRCACCQKVRCSNVCKDYTKKTCPTVARAPHVCNGCPKNTGCTLERYYYRARDAQALADAKKTTSREGIDLTPEAAEAMLKLVRPLLEKRQSPAQIWLTHADELPVSRRTFYRYVQQGLFGFTALDLPKKACYKQRRKARKEDPWVMPEGRAYVDFSVLDSDVKASAVEMDSVCGTKDDMSAILTFYFKSIHFQVGLYLTRHDKEHVVAAFDYLEDICGKEVFSEIFALILTDRGIEFRDHEGMERDGRCKVFYCDARRSDQKAAAEKNHVELRKKIPKGTRLDSISQHEVSEAFSHVNSTPRRSLFGAAPMQLAKALLPHELLDMLGLYEIPPDEVDLTP